MIRDDIVKWSAEAGIMPSGWGATENQWRSLEACAALVVAAERERKAWDAEYWTAYEQDVAAAEREACAKLCEDLAKWCSETVAAAFESAAEEIRMRGEKNNG
jgi:hypothetical protein